MKPLRLKKGDTIGIAAPASKFDRERFEKGCNWLKKQGFELKYNKSIFNEDMYFAGGDRQRADELNALIADPDISAILFARGGYGTQRILPLLDISLLKEYPKVVVGFSDITPLLNAINSHCGLSTFYGPVVCQLHDDEGDEKMLKSFLNAVTVDEPLGEFPLNGATVLKEGEADGEIVGGCLSLVTSSIGTRYEVQTKDKILLLEDTGEKVYAIDRMLTQLKNSGRLKDVKAIIFGSIDLHKDETAPENLATMLHKTLDDFPGPVITNIPTGHRKPFLTIPLGVKVRVSTKPLAIHFEEAAIK